MIDLHAHILPGCDDGAKDWNESMRMCTIALKDGIETIVATPHTLKGVYKNNGQKIKETCARLNEMLKEKHIAVTIIPGADVWIDPSLLRLVMDGEALTINDDKRYIMLEFPEIFIFPPIEKLISRLRDRGITTIISHPERNNQFRREIDLLATLVEEGVLCQITAMSITGDFGNTVRKFTEKLLSRNLAHIIATDCHSAIRRLPVMSKAVGAASRIIGLEKTRKMVEDIPRAILDGRDIKSRA